MRILHVQFVDPVCGMGGAEQVVFNLAEAMKERYRFHVQGAVNECRLANRLREAHIPVSTIFREKFKTLTTLKKMGEIIGSFRPDLVHSHHRYATFLIDIFFKRQVKILHTEHLWNSNKRAFFRYGHFAAAVSEEVRSNLISRYKVPPERVKTIPNAVRPRVADPVRLRALQVKYPKRHDQLFGVCLGRLEKQKGHRYLMEAVQRLPPAYRDRLKFFLAGEGTLKSSLQMTAAEKGVAGNFIFLDFYPDVAELLSLGDFLILPSLWEGMPLAVIEAYSASRPVIATDIPGTREIVINEKTGRLVPPLSGAALADGLQWALDSTAAFKTMGEEAYCYWKAHFSFDAMIETYYELYLQIIGAKY
jgi:glycosyltransferase involved in cell wall biosynthesis